MERIPDNVPLVLRPSKERLGTYYGLSILIIAMLPGCFILALAAATGFDVRVVGIFVLLFAPIVLMTAGVLIWRVLAELRSGPTLSANADGLWIQARKWPVRAQWLHWEEIAWIAVRRYGVDRSVCVMPRTELPAPGQDRRERSRYAANYAITGFRTPPR